ncbi:MAG TPA: GNVR domain-containing protein [Bryobacteraceae bacterium]|nr:GNVR domain-containing protein [Bryobacteraceae bacterium]HXR76557.1 GNVR domain-containing protein [Bryobacteraceae bacterium]
MSSSEAPVAEKPDKLADSHRQNGEISFADIFATLSGHARTIFWTMSITALVSTVVAFLIPVEYTAEAVILTPEHAESSLSAMAQLAGVGPGMGLSGLSLLSGFGLRNPSDLYVGILESRTIADALINRFQLKKVYNDKYLQRARKHLARRTTIKAGKDTLIHIQVDDRDPTRAAKLANAYVEELSLRNTTVALTEASQRRLFFEQQLTKEKKLLAAAEVALRDTQQFTGLVVPSGQAEALIRSASQLHAEIMSREAQLAGMRSYVADDNPRLQMVNRELAALRSELAKLETGEHVAGTPEVPVGNLPQAGLQYLRKYRDVKYHEGLYEALSKQYEAARLDEAKAAPLVQVIDNAVVPERKSWPPRTLIILISTVLAALISSLWILVGSKPVRQNDA